MTDKNQNNNGIMFGHSSRLEYDKGYYTEKLTENVAPGTYRLNPDQIHNHNASFSGFGPRSSYGGYGVSTTVGHTVAPSQDLVDVESMLSNRGVPSSKLREHGTNNVNMSKYELQHAKNEGNFLDPLASRLTNPPQTYRGMSINRFFDLPRNPQANIFWDDAINTKLEAKDNYREKLPKLKKPDVFPKEIKGKNKPCVYSCSARCPPNSNCEHAKLDK